MPYCDGYAQRVAVNKIEWLGQKKESEESSTSNRPHAANGALSITASRAALQSLRFPSCVYVRADVVSEEVNMVMPVLDPGADMGSLLRSDGDECAGTESTESEFEQDSDGPSDNPKAPPSCGNDESPSSCQFPQHVGGRLAAPCRGGSFTRLVSWLKLRLLSLPSGTAEADEMVSERRRLEWRLLSCKAEPAWYDWS